LYTPEGQPIVGSQSLAPGTGLLLFKRPPTATVVRREWNPVQVPQLAHWLQGSQVAAQGQVAAYVAVPAAGTTAPRDLMLDALRTLHPDTRLVLRIHLNDPNARIYAVAEVDDDGHRWDHAAVEISSSKASTRMTSTPALRYKVPQSPGRWPLFPLQTASGSWQTVVLDPSIFKHSPVHFRRWAYLRIKGPLGFASARIAP
jgi:hypothetical protein